MVMKVLPTRQTLAQAASRTKSIRIDIGSPIHTISTKVDSEIAEKTLAGKAKIFRQNGRLVHIVGTAGREPAGISTVTQCSLPVLLSDLGIIFYEIRNTKKGQTTKDLSGCTQEFAKRFLSDAHRGKSKIPELTGICTAPTIRRDGSVIELPGFDKLSGLYLILDQEFPKIPESPCKEDAQEAIKQLIAPFATFPFKDGAAKSAFLTMLFTAVVRRSLRSAPAGLIDAPAMGTGKSLLSWSIGYLATGQSVLSMTFPFSQNEQKKTIFAALLAGAAVISFDNIEVPVKGSALCTCITEEIYSDRILGASETASAPCGALIVLNGNNLSVEADMCTRVIPCTLDAEVENPHLRQFQLDIKKYVAKHRVEMVINILTVIRAYLQSGETILAASRFSDWSHFVREPLMWIGETDPMNATTDMTSRDPVRNTLGDVLESLYDYYGSTPFVARDAVTPPNHGDKKKYVMQEALEAAVKTSISDLNARTLGRYFDKYRNRIVNGRKLVNTQAKKDNNILWCVEIVDPIKAAKDAEPSDKKSTSKAVYMKLVDKNDRTSSLSSFQNETTSAIN